MSKRPRQKEVTLADLPRELDRIDTVGKASLDIDASIRSAALVGSHATRYTVPHKKSARP